MNDSGQFVEYTGNSHLTSFEDLPHGNELVGNLFGHDGIYPLMDLTGVDAGEYVFNVELFNQSGQQIQFVGQEIVEVM